MAGAGKITIAEVEELLPAGSLDLTKFIFQESWYNASFKEKSLKKNRAKNG
jgi:acyl CoA:acetate/3-ketoacid CoA transferase alpha subunit